jgi:putative transposase
MGLDPRQPIPKGTRIEPSNRMRRRQQRIGRLTARLNDLRREALHQASRALVNGSQVICVEDLSVRGLARGRHRGMRRSVHDASMGELGRLLSYKATWAGREVVKVDRFFPSSQLCSTPGCDYRNTGLRLKDRQWCCPQCGVTHDRDVNAARNIEREGLRLLAESASGGEVRDVRGRYASAAGGYPSVGQPSLKKRKLMTWTPPAPTASVVPD